MSIWIPHLIYFWFSVLSLCIAPFVFNPHQFSFTDFIIDYREFLRWMSRGNSRTKASSWYGYCRLSRTMITGYKKKKLGHPSEKLSGDVPRATWKNSHLFRDCLATSASQCYSLLRTCSSSHSLIKRQSTTKSLNSDRCRRHWTCRVERNCLAGVLLHLSVPRSHDELVGQIWLHCRGYCPLPRTRWHGSILRILRMWHTRSVDTQHHSFSPFFSGSSNSGTRPMRFWVSSQSLPFKELSRRS
jgi:hypothetical protein